MDLTIPRDTLRELIAPAESVAPAKPHQPILSCLRVIAAEGSLSVDATDLVVSYRGSRPCTIRKPGGVCIPATMLSRVVAAMPRGDLTISVDSTNSRVSIKSAGARTATALPASPVEDYPELLDALALDGQPVMMPAAALREALAVTHAAMSSDDTRPHLAATLLDVTARGIRAVATEGKWLALCDRSLDLGKTRDVSALIPRAFLDLARGHLPSDGNVTLVLSQRGPIGIARTTDRGSDEWTTQLVDAAFPSYQQVVPTRWEGVVTVSRTALLEAVKACMVAGDGSLILSPVTESGKTSLSIESVSVDGSDGEMRDAIDAAITDKPAEAIRIPGAQVAAALSALSCDDVDLRLEHDESPLFLVPSVTGGEPRERFVIMPHRMIERKRKDEPKAEEKTPKTPKTSKGKRAA